MVLTVNDWYPYELQQRLFCAGGGTEGSRSMGGTRGPSVSAPSLDEDAYGGVDGGVGVGSGVVIGSGSGGPVSDLYTTGACPCRPKHLPGAGLGRGPSVAPSSAGASETHSRRSLWPPRGRHRRVMIHPTPVPGHRWKGALIFEPRAPVPLRNFFFSDITADLDKTNEQATVVPGGRDRETERRQTGTITRPPRGT